jgi:hypothetical protein
VLILINSCEPLLRCGSRISACGQFPLCKMRSSALRQAKTTTARRYRHRAG